MGDPGNRRTVGRPRPSLSTACTKQGARRGLRARAIFDLPTRVMRLTVRITAPFGVEGEPRFGRLPAQGIQLRAQVEMRQRRTKATGRWCRCGTQLMILSPAKAWLSTHSSWRASRWVVWQRSSSCPVRSTGSSDRFRTPRTVSIPRPRRYPLCHRCSYRHRFNNVCTGAGTTIHSSRMRRPAASSSSAAGSARWQAPTTRLAASERCRKTRDLYVLPDNMQRVAGS